MAQSDKPAIIVLHGCETSLKSPLRCSNASFRQVPCRKLRYLAAKAAGREISMSPRSSSREEEVLQAQAQELAWRPCSLDQKYLRGLFSGGTLCYESQVIWRGMLKEQVLSNASLKKEDRTG